MVNVQLQTDYWINSAEDDLVTASLLIREKRYLHGLFFCHLVIEKAIKANYVKTLKEVAPRSHNLNYLSDKAAIEFSDENYVFIGILMKYQLQGRYPDYHPVIPDENTIMEYLNNTKNLLQ